MGRKSSRDDVRSKTKRSIRPVMKQHVNPTANIVIFGGKGDLTWRKLIPAFYNLYISGYLPAQFAIYGVHYEKMKEADYEKHLLEGVNTFSRSGKANKQEWKKFTQ